MKFESTPSTSPEREKVKWYKKKIFINRIPLVIIIIFVLFIMLHVLNFFGISGGLLYIIFGKSIGFKSGGSTYSLSESASRHCTCVGMPANRVYLGSSEDYCLGFIINCHCYLNHSEIDCDCPEGKYYVFGDGPKEMFENDACKLFKEWGAK